MGAVCVWCGSRWWVRRWEPIISVASSSAAVKLPQDSGWWFFNARRGEIIRLRRLFICDCLCFALVCFFCCCTLFSVLFLAFRFRVCQVEASLRKRCCYYSIFREFEEICRINQQEVFIWGFSFYFWINLDHLPSSRTLTIFRSSASTGHWPPAGGFL